MFPRFYNLLRPRVLKVVYTIEWMFGFLKKLNVNLVNYGYLSREHRPFPWYNKYAENDFKNLYATDIANIYKRKCIVIGSTWKEN